MMTSVDVSVRMSVSVHLSVSLSVCLSISMRLAVYLIVILREFIEFTASSNVDISDFENYTYISLFPFTEHLFLSYKLFFFLLFLM